MKHAFLIIAHGNFNQLKTLIKSLDWPSHDIYVHIDKKNSSFDINEFIGITNNSRLFFFQEYKVYWGGYSLVQVELLLFEKAKEKGYDYYHLLSGADLPLKSNNEIDLFFSENNGYEFILFDENKMMIDPEIRRRTRLYHFLQNYRRRYKTHFINSFFTFIERILLVIQLIFNIDRTKNVDWEIKYGSQWVSITHDLVCEILKNKEKIYKIFSYTNCSDELFIQTIAYNCGFKNSIYRFSSNCIANMRYIDWSRSKNGNPYIFKKDDYAQIVGSNMLFARKFLEDIDSDIILDILNSRKE